MVALQYYVDVQLHYLMNDDVKCAAGGTVLHGLPTEFLHPHLTHAAIVQPNTFTLIKLRNIQRIDG